MKQLPTKVIFIGTGPSALFAARKLQQLADSQKKKIEFVFIEREHVVGGKCHTYTDPKNPELKTEEGAGALAPNYGVVLDVLKEYKIDFEDMLPMSNETVEIRQLFDKLPFTKKAGFINKLNNEFLDFNKDVDVYNKAKISKSNLPNELLLPFTEYAKLRNMKYLPIFVKPFVPGFGYGAITHCPTYSILEYLGKSTLPGIIIAEDILKRPGLLAIHGGFQLLMEKMAAKHDVRLNSKVTHIDRAADQVTVHYQQNGMEHIETADTLILANSPRNWSSLGMNLTDTEQKCIDQLEYYRYPIAVYKIKGLPAQQYYFPKALEENGFKHLALITSRDDREDPEDGRLCTVYVNLPPNDTNFSFNHEAMISELKTIKGVTDVIVVKEKIWEDYMSTLPWDLRLKLDKDQGSNNTVYLGSYTLGGFEDIACCAANATYTMSELFSLKPDLVYDSAIKNAKRCWQFFTAPIYHPVQDLNETEEPESGWCTIV